MPSFENHPEYFANKAFKRLGELSDMQLLTETLHKANEISPVAAPPDLEASLNCLKGEVKELEEAFRNGETASRLRNELGDCFLNVINLCRFAGVCPEQTLAASVERWLKREALLETFVFEAGYTWSTVPAEISLQLWDKVKKELKQEEEK